MGGGDLGPLGVRARFRVVPDVPCVSFCGVPAFLNSTAASLASYRYPPPPPTHLSSARLLLATPGWAQILCARCKPALLCHQDYRLRGGRLMTDNPAPRLMVPRQRRGGICVPVLGGRVQGLQGR